MRTVLLFYVINLKLQNIFKFLKFFIEANNIFYSSHSIYICALQTYMWIFSLESMFFYFFQNHLKNVETIFIQILKY